MGLAIELAERAARRRAATVRQEMRRGLDGLPLVMAIAPLAGLLLTVRGIVTSFPKCGCDKWTLFAVVNARLSFAIWPAAFGIAIAVAAWWFYRILSEQCEAFELEVATTRSDLVGWLGRYGNKLAA